MNLSEGNAPAPTYTAVTIVIQALSTNTGTVTVGASTTVAAAGSHGSSTRRGIALAASDTISLDAIDLKAVWVDATASGDGVSWVVGAA